MYIAQSTLASPSSIWMFLHWLNITVSTVSDLLWHLGLSPPPPTFIDGLPEQKPESLPSPPQPITFGCSTPPLYALVIGIDKYFSNGVRDLKGAVADADARLLVPKDQIKNLRNEDATRVTIETEIKRLGDNAAIKKDDPILIYYAGHGAEADAPSGWPSTSKKIQMLVSHDFDPSESSDSKRGQGVLDVRLSHLLADLAAKKSDNITVIFDCCHSGSGTRMEGNDPTFAVRGTDLSKTYTVDQDLLHDIEPDARAGVVAKGFEKSGLSSHMLLSACKAGQAAMEKLGRGAFTSALLILLQDNGVDKLTYKDVITNLPDLPAQDPQCKGVHQNRYLFNSKVTNPQCELYPIRASGMPGRYTLEAGEAHGITSKAEFVVFADRNVVSVLGTVVASTTTAFTTTCDFAPRGDETPFSLASIGYALQTGVGEGQDICLFIEPDIKLLGVFKQIADEMQSIEAAKRRFRLVEKRSDKPDLVIGADGDVVHFEIMDERCRQHELTRMPFKVKIDDSDTIHRILQCSADFYWHLHCSTSQGAPLASNVTLECMKLKETGKFTDDLQEILEPDGDNLNIEGVISVNVDEDAMYGFKITNTMSVPLYVSMFYFDVSDLSIDSYYQPGSAKDGAVDVSLPARELLTIGYGASGTVPHMYALREGQDVDVGFLKLFFSTENIDLSGIIQKSPFVGDRESKSKPMKRKPIWDSICVTLVQRAGSATGP
ncbi:uncharacterized protein BT62DRAFT_997422 [Guyanagaster necrorhizus]|uniref:Peptidase C14 caspase domain-containing protein n=1 Tax=Guyanagaster necrorhizus TaxID=856835 RepID=A0A9P8AMN3_9AGAR|nr:uncharacterized protein BT62DRAFT_997422 [Guyanagaster necrorhizus MCA 3950]KAG7440929.1 hypothetical protein BT62DRAFT_997422 [Guyanagaster necrorhizus MCA 3950]